MIGFSVEIASEQTSNFLSFRVAIDRQTGGQTDISNWALDVYGQVDGHGHVHTRSHEYTSLAIVFIICHLCETLTIFARRSP